MTIIRIYNNFVYNTCLVIFIIFIIAKEKSADALYKKIKIFNFNGLYHHNYNN